MIQPHLVPQLKRATNSGTSPIATGRYVDLDGEACYRIANVQSMAPFFMSLISANDHWAFLASNGAITAGRRNPSNALFPYYCADKLIDMVASTGPLTLLKLQDSQGRLVFWRPFFDPIGPHHIVRNLYKNILGTRIYFEEVNAELGLTFRYCWQTSPRFGFVRTCSLINLADENRQIEIVDGIQNILPYGVDEAFQQRFSNLVDAYKKCELISELDLGIYYLSSIPTDHPEPSEGLRATVAWQQGLPRPSILLSQRQLTSFLRNESLKTVSEIRGERGFYLAHSVLDLPPLDTQRWTIVADLAYDQTDVADLVSVLKDPTCESILDSDIRQNEANLTRILAGADGFQLGESCLHTHRHLSNVIFNLMRGGTPQLNYQIDVHDFKNHVEQCNQSVFCRNESFLNSLDSSTISRQELLIWAQNSGDIDLIRIASEYLPLMFGRRHGDPTRPWNRFSIELKNEDGSPRIHYEGNWRDIFQNWEALGLSFPRLLTGMILRFVNASTADGYNPYRINREGFDWERLDPSDPWANIGYWGDHQIAYLHKLLDWCFRFSPEELIQLLDQPIGVYANVPYRIRPYVKILENWDQTIDYDDEESEIIAKRVAQLGADGRLLMDSSGNLQRASLMEKLLLPALIKMTNFIPEAGIWMNTQRPEWNDANNALVGKGASIVTVCYLRRYFQFLLTLVENSRSDHFSISQTIVDLLQQVVATLQTYKPFLSSGFSPTRRRQFVDRLQLLGCQYRQHLYQQGLKRDVRVAKEHLLDFIVESLRNLDHTIDASERSDGLFHAYNLISFSGSTTREPLIHPDWPLNHAPNEPLLEESAVGELKVESMYEMLEGQVAVLNSGRLSLERTLELLKALRNSRLYRDDIGSYLLYPDRELPQFLEKNIIDPTAALKEPLIDALLENNVQRIIRRDQEGNLRFNGDFRNSDDLAASLNVVANRCAKLAPLIRDRSKHLQELFRDTFQHHQFTGRSCTFFAYEGLGSVYWHMISKLLLAVGESYVHFNQQPQHTLQSSSEMLSQLRKEYREIREGLGITSLPSKYGAFPIDPYSHTPKHAGAQQPGMTGQVKEDILSRMLELGIRIKGSVLSFEPELFEVREFLVEGKNFHTLDGSGQSVAIEMKARQFGFTFCQVPIIYVASDRTEVRVYPKASSQPVVRSGNRLTPEESKMVFDRVGTIERIEFLFPVT